jgi:hypothetical protein
VAAQVVSITTNSGGNYSTSRDVTTSDHRGSPGQRLTVSTTDFGVPVVVVTEMVTRVSRLGRWLVVVTVKPAVLAPAARYGELGFAISRDVESLKRYIPPPGAGPLMVTVPDTVEPYLTEVERSVTDVTVGTVTAASETLTVYAPSCPETVLMSRTLPG